MKDVERFRFIGHALAGDGPFRPQIVENGLNGVEVVGKTALVRYPRESKEKFARRNEVAFYASPLARAVERFIGYLFSRAPVREFPHALYQAMADDINGKADAIDVWWGTFAAHLKARGSMLLLVDMPRERPQSLGAQIAQRVAPYWTMVKPEQLVNYQLGDDGKFDHASFSGTWPEQDGSRKDCVWHFDRSGWSATDSQKLMLGSGEHPLGECPLLIATEGGEFPHFGPFAAIADLSRRLFNLESELDEILRSQTFSLLTMEVPKEATEQAKLAAAKTAGETIGTSNLLMHSGSTPAFIAPPDGPARVYMDRINDVRGQINEIALTPRESAQRESGEAMRLRFQATNGELARFAGRLEDIERRAWDLSRRWLEMTVSPTVQWARDFNMADVESELATLQAMRDAGMPREVLVEQQRRIVSVQFAGLAPQEQQQMMDAIDAIGQEQETGGNVIPLIPDRNAGVRAALEGFLRSGDGSA